MYIATVPNRNSPPAILLREGYREDGKVKSRTLANLSKLPPDAVEVLRRVLKGEKLVSAEEVFEIVQDGSRQHGHVEAVLTAMRRLGFANLVASRRSYERDLVVAMVAARILEPQSKLSTTEWWHTTTLPQTLGVDGADEDDLYAAMDWLLERQADIEKKLAGRHLEDDGLMLYDLTSSYFEGVTCPLAALGHNRDRKKGTLQVNYGLLTDQRGRPVSVSVFKGNTGDPKTLLPQVDKVRDDFGIERFVLVGDRGMITQKQIDAMQDLDGIDWITALRTEAIRKIVGDGSLQLGLFDDCNLFQMTHPDFPGERLVACRNNELAHRRAHKRTSLLDATVEELNTVRRMVERGRLRGAQVIGQRVRKVLSQSKIGRHFKPEIRDDGFDFEIDEAQIVAEVTGALVRELDKVRRMVERGKLAGEHDIGERVANAVNKRKVGRYFKVTIADNGFDFEIDKATLVAEATDAVVQKLEKVRQGVQRGQLYGQDEIGVRVGKVINKYKVGKHFQLDIRDDGFNFEIDEQKVADEAALDGIYVVRTSVAEQRLDAANTVRGYKLLANVERAFRSFKTIDLKVRPIHHRLVNRVRAHIFLCMLAYYVQWHMLEAWRPLLFSDEDQEAKATRDPVAPAKRSGAASRKAQTKHLDDGTKAHSFQTLISHLGAMIRNTCRRRGAGPEDPTFDMDTPANPKQKRALELLRTINV